MVCLYMHFKVGRSGETWDQRNKKQCSFVLFFDTFEAWPMNGETIPKHDGELKDG